MIVVDTSAWVAIILDEPEKSLFLERIASVDMRYTSPASLLEARMVLYRRSPDLIALLDRLILRMRAQIEPVTASQADIAFEAFRRYSKGTGHKAGLNFGDCFAYALAIERAAPLLYKGDDFIHTDVKSFQM